jgi:hypothetical protein
MDFNKNLMLGKKVILYPNDTYEKIALINDVNDLGFTFEILKSRDPRIKIGSVYFYNHAKPIIFQILE